MPDNDNTANNGSSVDKLWELFSSMKLGLVLLGVIAVTASIGTVVPQAAEDPQRAEQVGALWQALGFTNLYSTIWFRLLLGLLCVNLIVCSIQRFNGIYTKTFKPRVPNNLKAIPQKVSAEVQGETASLKQTVQAILTEKRYRVTAVQSETGWSFVAQKHRLGYWGSFITHLAFVVLVIGALIGSLFGFKGYFMAGAGQTVPIQSIQLQKGKITENYSIRINSAEDRFLPNGERDNWYTDMSIMENGREVARKTISVNHPFSYQGVTFYQADFADAFRLTADVKGQKIPVVLRDQGGNYYQAPGSDLALIVAASNNDPKKPVILYQVYKGNSSEPVQTGQLALGQSADIQGQYTVKLNGVTGFTGLQVKQDPGVPVIWLGSALLIGGLLLSFYWRPRVVSGLLQAQGTKGKLTFGASTGKVVEGIKAEFAELETKIRERQR